MNEENKEVITEKITKLHYLDEPVVCDNNHAFSAMNALLIPFICNNEDLGNIIHTDTNLRLKLGSNPSEKEIQGYLLACPICKVIHLSGFNPARKEDKLMSGMDNSGADERKLNPEL